MEAAETKATKGTINSTNDTALTEPEKTTKPTETKATGETTKPVKSKNDVALTEPIEQPIEPRNPTITLQPSGGVDSKEMEEPRPGIFDLLSSYSD